MDVFELFIYGGLYLWMFSLLPLSLKLLRWSPTSDAERGGGCKLQRCSSWRLVRLTKCSSMGIVKKEN